MTEYRCSCHINKKTYSIQTTGAITTHDAIMQMEAEVKEQGGDFSRVDGLIIDLIDVE